MKSFVLCLLLFSLASVDARCSDERSDCGELKDYCKTPLFRHECAKTCGYCDDNPPPEPEVPLPPHKGGCGTPDVQGVRVIAGKTPIRGSWPWQILMTYLSQPMCGGTLISPNWIVTAAHCVYKRDRYPQDFAVRVGEHDMRIPEGSEREFQVEKIVIHPEWNPNENNNDIAMMKLRWPVSFNKFVSPICLPSADPPVGSKCYITGWGKIKHPGSMTPLLQQGELPVVSNEVCDDHNQQAVPITDAMICGGSGGSSPLSGCHGDSGGPYVCEINGRWELHGSVSYGSPSCESSKSYTVFSRTFFFKPWILKQMEIN